MHTLPPFLARQQHRKLDQCLDAESTPEETPVTTAVFPDRSTPAAASIAVECLLSRWSLGGDAIETLYEYYSSSYAATKTITTQAFGSTVLGAG